MTDDLKPDPEIATALRSARAEPPFDAVDWDRLHARIIARVRRSIITLTWWEQAARWSRALVPLAAAASVILTIALWRQLDARDSSTTLAEAPTFESTVVSEDSALEVLPSIIGPSSAEALLQAVVSP